MKKYIYISIILVGVILFVIALLLKNAITTSILISIGTGLFSSGLTAGLIDLVNYIDFCKKKKYRRKIELHHLSFCMLIVARFVLGEHENKDINDILDKLSGIEITEDNKENMIQAIETERESIKKEIETIRKVQDYLSLSGFFSDMEIVFLCRSINYYQSVPTKENVRFILDNIMNYLKMFVDTLN